MSNPVSFSINLHLHFTAFLGQFGLSASFQWAKFLRHSCIKHDVMHPSQDEAINRENRAGQSVGLTPDRSTISERGQSVATLLENQTLVVVEPGTASIKGRVISYHL